jgi:pimeloyl-ACP methyl ester carboxylesterase
MFSALVALLVFSLLTILLLIFIPPQKVVTDLGSPLNIMLYQEPSTSYPNQFVNLWVDKPWRTDSSRIPCHVEFFDSDKYIIYSHGNGENLLTALPFTSLLATKLQANVICYDYSGYGLNAYDAYERSAEGVNATLKAVYNHLLNREQSPVSSSDICLVGYSLGTGCSVQLAAELGPNVGGLVLIAAYASILEVVKESVSTRLGAKAAAQIASMFTERWNNLRAIPQVKCPILLLHGKYDQLIPLKHAQKLKQASSNSTLIETDCGHASFNWENIASHIETWRATN